VERIATGARRASPTAAALAATLGAGLTLSACGSAGPASAAGGYALRFAQAPAMLVQCGFDRGVVSPDGTHPWYLQGQVLAFSGSQGAGHRAEFGAWWAAHSNVAVTGKSLAAWRKWAAEHDQLPPALCGSFTTIASLHAQIYPGQQDPWKT
jgi:hypothetical protein